MKRYLVRLDDACPYMNRERWGKIEEILDRYSIRPLVGIIPDNQDRQTMIDPEDAGFWDKALNWQKKGWSIALHGYSHCCESVSGGINPVHNRSEFAGLKYEEQLEKIKKGYEILAGHGLDPTYFFAPSHTYDENTLRTLQEATPIRLISDTFSRFPYRDNFGCTTVPCQMGKFRNIPLSGYWTFCFHPNIMKDEEISAFEDFIKANRDNFTDFQSLPLEGFKGKSMIDKLLSKTYYYYRRKKSGK